MADIQRQLREPESQKYIYVDPITRDIQLLVPIVGGGESGIGIDNTCQATIELRAFFTMDVGAENSAKNILIRYKMALEFDIAALGSAGRTNTALFQDKQMRLASINHYIELLAAIVAHPEITELRQGYPQYPNAIKALMAKDGNNILSMQLSPVVPDSFCRMVNYVFSMERSGPFSLSFANQLRSSFTAMLSPRQRLSPKDELIASFNGRVSPSDDQQLLELINDINNRLQRLSGNASINVGKAMHGQTIDMGYITSVMCLDQNDPINDYVINILNASLNDGFWDDLTTSPFNSVINIQDQVVRKEKLSILTQFFLAQVNIYCYANNLSVANFGQILENNIASLREVLVVTLISAIQNNGNIEELLFDFINRDSSSFGINRPLTITDFNIINQRFICHYKTINGSLHFDEFLLFLPERTGNAVNHKSLISISFADFYLAGGYSITEDNRRFLRKKAAEFRNITKRELTHKNGFVNTLPPATLPPATLPSATLPVPTTASIAGYIPANEALLLPAMQAPLRYIPNIGVLHTSRLHSNGVQIAGPYSDTQALPQIPVIHPYNPTDGGISDGGIARFSLATILPIGTITNLPPGVREFLVQGNVNMANVTCAISIQNKPWQNIPLLFRPQSWLHQDAPQVGGVHGYNRASNVMVSIAQVGGRFGALMPFGVSSHGDPGRGVVFSPNNMEIQGVGNIATTDTFYSVCIEPVQGGNPARAIITLHYLLSVADQTIVEHLIEGMRIQNVINGTNFTLEDFITQLTMHNVINEEVAARQHGINTAELDAFVRGGRNIVQEQAALVDSVIRLRDAVVPPVRNSTSASSTSSTNSSTSSSQEVEQRQRQAAEMVARQAAAEQQRQAVARQQAAAQAEAARQAAERQRQAVAPQQAAAQQTVQARLPGETNAAYHRRIGH